MKLRFLSALIARLKVFCNVDFEQRDELQHGTWRTTFGGSELAWSSYFVPTDAGCAVIMWSENLSARLYAEANRPPIVDEWLAAAQKYIEANPSPTAEAIFRRLQSES